MASKIPNTSDDIQLYDDVILSKRGEYWQFRMWLKNERKYARFSLKTQNQNTAIEKAKQYYHELMAQQLQGKAYFSLTTKIGVERYLKQRWKDVEVGIIVKGRYSTIKTHLEHRIDYIKRDTKLKELERTDCEDYFYSRTKTTKKLKVSQTTVQNEQSSINALMAWLYKNKLTHIEAFDFKKLPRVDKGNDALRRATFSDDEIRDIKLQLESYVAEARQNLDAKGNWVKFIVGHYLLISLLTGLRRGEQLQLRWQDIEFMERRVGDDEHSLIKIKVRGETSKVRKTRTFVVKDREYFENLFNVQYSRIIKAQTNTDNPIKFANALIFSTHGKDPITIRAISYHFDRIMALADIQNMAKRDLVPYSFRHYFITHKVNCGLTPTQVAEMCGTSTTQIENTYYHTTEDKMISNALVSYYYKDGMLVPK